MGQLLLEVKFELLMSSCHPLKQLSNGTGLTFYKSLLPLIQRKAERRIDCRGAPMMHSQLEDSISCNLTALTN